MVDCTGALEGAGAQVAQVSFGWNYIRAGNRNPFIVAQRECFAWAMTQGADPRELTWVEGPDENDPHLRLVLRNQYTLMRIDWTIGVAEGDHRRVRIVTKPVYDDWPNPKEVFA